LNPALPSPVLSEEGGRPALLVGGVVQSVAVESAGPGEYWPAMLPDTRPGHALLLGAGGGTLAALLTRRFGGVRILAIDDDPRVVALGLREFYLGLPNVQVVLADAFAFVASCQGHFDYIAVDLFHAGARPRAILGRPFLGDLHRLSAPRGTVVYNFFDDRRLETALLRIGRVLMLTRRIDLGRNVVAHFRA